MTKLAQQYKSIESSSRSYKNKNKNLSSSLIIW